MSTSFHCGDRYHYTDDHGVTQVTLETAMATTGSTYHISMFDDVYDIQSTQINPNLVKELKRKYALAKLQKNKTEMSNLERQLKYHGN